jgi:hypothetical protein
MKNRRPFSRNPVSDIFIIIQDLRCGISGQTQKRKGGNNRPSFFREIMAQMYL